MVFNSFRCACGCRFVIERAGEGSKLLGHGHTRALNFEGPRPRNPQNIPRERSDRGIKKRRGGAKPERMRGLSAPRLPLSRAEGEARPTVGGA